MTFLGKKTARSTFRRWLWSNRAAIFVIPLLFGGGTQLLPQTHQSQPDTTVADADAPLTFTITRIPNRAPRVATILANDAPATPILAPSSPNLNQSVTVATDHPLDTFTSAPRAVPVVPIRVGIVRGGSRVRVETSAAVMVCDRNHQPITTLAPNTQLTLRPSNHQLSAGETQFPEVIWLKSLSNDWISIKGRWYRGTIQLILHNNQIIAVNHLDLDTYLYGVVGSEMPALWPLEALKAQAIAARSYALSRVAHPFSQFYDIGDTPRWQAYQGTETETDSVHTAVNSTRGLVLFYDGSIVESLYAATEHLVRSVHRGYGMSQNGARQLAQQQYTYREILAAFYPGTQLIGLSDAS